MTTTEPADAPYADGRERLLEELHRIDLLLRRHLEDWWAKRETGEGEFRGLFVSDAEVDRLLATPDAGGGRSTPDAGADSRAPDVGDRNHRLDAGDRTLERSIATLADRIEARASAASGPTPIGHLAREFALDRAALDALLLALAPDLDRKYGKVYGYLQDDVTRTRPSVGLLVRVLAADAPAALSGRERFQRGSTLVDEGLLEVPDDGRPFVARPAVVPERIASYVLGGAALPAGLVDAASVVEPDGDLDALDLETGRRAALDGLRDDLGGGSGVVPMAALVGPDTATASRAVEAVAPTARPLLRVDASALSGEAREVALRELRREVRLRQASVHVHDTDGVGRRSAAPEADDGPPTSDAVQDLLVSLDRLPAPVFVTGDVEVPARIAPRLDAHRLTVIEFDLPDRERRAAHWRDQPLPDDVEPAALADAFRLSRGEIEDAVETARSIVGDGVDPDAAALRVACRSVSAHRLDEHAREIEPTYDWADIVLPPDTEARLREAAAQVRNRGTVLESWGFAERHGRGNGVALLFTGPSGTGKTMAAEVIAADVGLPLYAIDLATMLSKYVGETEENLKRVFDAAERTNALLFFDEADALFGERSEVSDAHDRYANVEVDYLLQRLEAHDGCVVLASNLAENIDDAFRRRIDVAVEFPHPDRDARAEIWADAFPADTPTADLDLEYLAGFDLTGGNITSVARAAAFMAAEEGAAVEMSHVVRALRREFQKEGRLFDRTDFEPYGEVL